MTPRQNDRAHGDLRHHNRKQRLQKLLAAKPKPKAAKPSGAVASEDDDPTALVVGRGPGLCLVSTGAELRYIRCDLPVAPGDIVSIRFEKVAAIAPRRTILSRTDPANARRDRIIAANLDLLVIVVSIANPPFRPGLVDRYIIAAARAGIQPILCINKIDLCPGACPPGIHQIPTVRCSTSTGQGIDELRDLLAGNLSVLAGHSGVGKSSLLNALASEDHARTGDVSAETGKGRQTTTAARLYQLRNGARIIDTPGIREFGLGRLTIDEIREAFPEFREQNCRFSDCTHRDEPDCAVRTTGGPRYASYLRLTSEL
jgi:ribosome small subunit-dependent GTPase A